MNTFLKFLSGTVLALFFSCGQGPVSIYVSPEGDDTQEGSKEQPVRTLQKAKSLAAAYAGKRKVNIILKDGTYYLDETIVFHADESGTEKFPVSLRAEREGQAVISGGKPLNPEWAPYKDGIYRAQISGGINIDQLYINGQRQRMARFPNAIEGKNVFDTWDLVHTKEPDPRNDPLSPRRIASWSHPKGAYLHAMHVALWGDMHWLVKGKKADGSLEIEGGWQNNRPSPMHPRYRMVENVFEELDAPGEWFFNQKENMLYYYPHAEADLSSAKVEIVRLKHLIEFQGTKENPVRFINLQGLVFKHTARSFMENKEPLLRSDWTVYRGGAVVFNGAEDCALTDCEFDQPGGNSIFVNNYNRRLLFKACYIHHGGANGIAFVGDPAMVRSPLFRYGKQDFSEIDRTPGPKGDNYPEDCLVEDCLITMTGRDEKQTSPIQISMSHKITVRHCSLYDVPRAGINISEGTFGGHLIEYCDVFNTVLETGDHGSFNSWGRDRFWTPDIKKTAEEIEKDPDFFKLDMLAPNTIRHSRWRCDHGWDIDLDDGSSWYNIYNNLLLSGGLKMREGYHRTATNNIILNNSLHPHVWYPGSGDVFKHNIVFGAYRPAVMKYGIAPEGKWGKEVDYNLFATNSADLERFRINGCDLNSIVGDPMFVNPRNGDFSLKDGSDASKIGFESFRTDQFGVVSEKLKKIAKTPEIPPVLLSEEKLTGEIYKWLGAEVKNVETFGEQSANGLSSKSGVLVVNAPNRSELAKKGIRERDVIIVYAEQEVKTFDQLLRIIKEHKNEGGTHVSIIRNQQLIRKKIHF